MNDQEFVLALLGEYGKDVAQSTLALMKNEMTTLEYIEESRAQFKTYGRALLEWKNGPDSGSEETGRDSEELQTSTV